MSTSPPNLPAATAEQLPRAPEAWEPFLRWSRLARRPLDEFLRIQAASGIVLLAAAAAALWAANSSWAERYQALWQTVLSLRVGDFVFERTLLWFVNDVWMVVFFFLVGLEIKRELHHGELSEGRRAALPAAAALGGMLAPAAVYLLLAQGQPSLSSGWGIPTATDIAFAVGVLTLLGPRVPPALRVLLLALAVIDDLGAVIVIALFYSHGFSPSGLAVAALGLAVVVFLQKLGVRRKLLYVVPGVVVWAGVYRAGIHPTLAGVVMGLMTPVRAWLGLEGFVRDAQGALSALTTVTPGNDEKVQETLHVIDLARREALSPAEALIAALSPWVAFVVMPVFAFANAGVSLDGLPHPWSGESAVVAVAVGLGLFLGKPLGVIGTTLLLTRVGVVTLPRGLSARHVVVLGVVAGIGFTMALFVAQLAFPTTAPAPDALLASAKLGVLAGSLGASLAGLALGRWLLRPVATPGAAVSADEAESLTDK
jgi:NhaA family Na+:H+ antiporter